MYDDKGEISVCQGFLNSLPAVIFGPAMRRLIPEGYINAGAWPSFILHTVFQFSSDEQVSGNNKDQACNKDRVIFLGHTIGYP